MVKGASRSYELLADSDDVGVVWGSKSGCETAGTTPGHDCLCSYASSTAGSVTHAARKRSPTRMGTNLSSWM